MEKFDLEKHWKDYLLGSVIVNCKTQSLAKDFLKYCHEQGLKWASDKSLSNYDNWDDYKERTGYRHNAYSSTYGSTYGDIKYMSINSSTQFVEFVGFEEKKNKFNSTEKLDAITKSINKSIQEYINEGILLGQANTLSAVMYILTTSNNIEEDIRGLIKFALKDNDELNEYASDFLVELIKTNKFKI